MARPRSTTLMTCQNKTCKFYHREEGKDIIKRGKNRAGNMQYFCNHCRKWFVETANTPLYHKHMSKEEIITISKLLVEKNGVRSIERITGHHRDTISRLMLDLAEHADEINEMLIVDLELTPVECDEFWTFVKKNKRMLTPAALISLKKAMHGSISD